MKVSAKTLNRNFNNIPVSSFWSNDSSYENLLHKIHAYPAKFPSLVVKKSLEYAEEHNIDVETVGDIFCGCGTTALESKLNKKNFWGVDINPVAALIARTKSESYEEKTLSKYFKKILINYNNLHDIDVSGYKANKRIQYWFDETQIRDLAKLLYSIKLATKNDKYRDFFLCGFSNILKGSSKWLTKSIKPQVDPKKKPSNVLESYKQQVRKMIKATHEVENGLNNDVKINIVNNNFLNLEVNKPFIDLLITSPPYVTSYEYADLHQLSTLWLKYVDDYRELRDGTIGSLYHKKLDNRDVVKLNDTGKGIFDKLYVKDKRKAFAVAKYFIDMKSSVEKAYNLMKNDALAVFVIGDTKYKSVDIKNSNYLLNIMKDVGFKDLNIFKRKISFKTLTPYRDTKGRFTKNKKGSRKVYNYEFVITGKK